MRKRRDVQHKISTDLVVAVFAVSGLNDRMFGHYTLSEENKTAGNKYLVAESALLLIRIV